MLRQRLWVQINSNFTQGELQTPPATSVRVFDILQTLGQVECPLQHRLKKRQFEDFGLRIKGWCVIFLDELYSACVIRMVFELIARVTVQTHAVTKVITFENRMVLNHLMISLAYVGLE